MWKKSQILAALPAFLFAAYPMAAVLVANVVIAYPDPTVVWRYLIIVWSVVAVALWAIRPLVPDLHTRAIWLTCLMFLSVLSLPLATLCRVAGLPFDTYATPFKSGFTVMAIGLATAITRPWKQKTRNPWPLNVMAIAVLGMAFVEWLSVAKPFTSPAWRGAADSMIQSAMVTSRAPVQAPSVFYVVLDAMGSPGTLREKYGLDTGAFVEFLRAEGFTVSDGARSNYGQTYLSLAATLNANYLDAVAGVMGPESKDRRPLGYLIQHNAMMKLASNAGYQTIAIGSDYQATETFSEVDVCLCPRFGLDQFEQQAIHLTPLTALPLGRWTFDAHRRKVLSQFSELERVAALPGPKFVFAHLIVPHPPFLFGADGTARRPERATTFTFDDGSEYPGGRSEYQAGYRDQATFVVQRTRSLVETLTRLRPKPVIVIHGDHGPGGSMHWESVKEADIEERFRIFAAYLFPGDASNLNPILSPVNVTRALARRYFGADLDPLPDKSFFSRWSRPYDFVRVLDGK